MCGREAGAQLAATTSCEPIVPPFATRARAQVDLLGALEACVPLSTVSGDAKTHLGTELLQPFMPATHFFCRSRLGASRSPSASSPSTWPPQLRCKQMAQLKPLVGAASSAGGRPVPRGASCTSGPSPFQPASCSLSTVRPGGGLSLRLQVLAHRPRAGASPACQQQQSRQVRSRPAQTVLRTGRPLLLGTVSSHRLPQRRPLPPGTSSSMAT